MRYDDLIEVYLRPVDVSTLRVGLEYEVRRQLDGELLVTGSTRHVWVNRDWKPIRLERAMPELYQLMVNYLK